MTLIDPSHPFYRPLWVRILIVAFCAGWAVLEVVAHEPFWMIIAGAAALYTAYMLLLTYKLPQPEPERPADPADDEEDDSATKAP